jgi:hypothetical protein
VEEEKMRHPVLEPVDRVSTTGRRKYMSDDLVARQKAVNEQVINRVASDPAFKDSLLKDPEEAFRELGLADEVEAIESEFEKEGSEVEAHSHACKTMFQGCTYWSSRYYCSGSGTKWGPWSRTGY